MKTLAERIEQAAWDSSPGDGSIQITVDEIIAIAAQYDAVMAQMAEALNAVGCQMEYLAGAALGSSMSSPERHADRLTSLAEIVGEWLNGPDRKLMQSALSAYQSLGEQS